MKGLKDVSAIGQAPALEEIMHVAAQGFIPRQYEDLLDHPTQRQIHIGFCSKRKNEQLEALVARSGKSKWQWTEFVFQ